MGPNWSQIVRTCQNWSDDKNMSKGSMSRDKKTKELDNLMEPVNKEIYMYEMAIFCEKNIV